MKGAQTPLPIAMAGATSAPVLLRKATDGAAATLLGDIGQRFVKTLHSQLREMGAQAPDVVPGPVKSQPSGEWRQSSGPAVIWQFKLAGIREPLELAANRPLVLQLVDIFYGGSGASSPARDEWSGAERRFASRFGETLAGLVAAAWDGTADLAPRLDTVVMQAGQTGPAPRDKPVLSQDFIINGKSRPNAELSWAYPLDDIEQLAEKMTADRPPSVMDNDRDWLLSLHRALGQVTLPVRSILSRPEISLGKMLALRVGDVIPLAMMDHVPVNVAGYGLAAGSVGEANGRVAIRIEHILQRSLS